MARHIRSFISQQSTTVPNISSDSETITLTFTSFIFNKSHFVSPTELSVYRRNMEALKVVLIALSLCAFAYGYGYRYSYDPYTGHTDLWTHLPGQEGPTYYNKFLKSNPALFRYVDPSGQVRWTCKDEAYYSIYLKKCVWKPSHFSKSRY